MRARRVLSVLSVCALAATTISIAVASAPSSADVPLSASSWLADAQSAWSEDYALKLAQLHGHDVQVLSETTEDSTVYALSDGSIRSESNALPVRVQADDGQWSPIDTTLGSDGAGSIVPAVTTVPVKFSDGGSGPLAQIQADSGQWLSVSWPGGVLPAPTLQVDSAIYPEVYPGVDLQMTATSQGFSEVLVVKDAAAAALPQLSSVRFGVSDGTLTSTPGAGGALVSMSTDGSVQLREGAPTWWDSSGDGADAAGPSDNGVPRPLPAASADASSVTVDASSVANSDVTYPVFVDPSWTGHRSTFIYVDSAYPTQNYLNGSGAPDSYAHVGYVDAPWSDDDHNHTTRSFFKMGDSAVKGKTIISAEFNTVLRYSSTCTATPVTLYINSANGDFGSGTTWNNQPALGSALDSASGTWRSGECEHGSASGQAIGFDATAGVAYTAAHNMDVINLALKAPGETDHQTWKKFGNNPTLSITADSAPTTPVGLAVRPCYLQCTGNVISRPTVTNPLTLYARSTDADNGLLTYHFTVYRGHAASGATAIWTGTQKNVAAGTTTTIAVPSSVFGSAGGDFEYRANATDNELTSTVSLYQQFTIDLTAPEPPSATLTGATTDPDVPLDQVTGTVGAPIGVDFSGSSGAVEIVYSVVSDVPTYASPPACGSGTGGIVIVCKSGGSWPAQTIAARDTTDALNMVGFDAAGNRSETGEVVFRVSPDVDNVHKGHSWQTATVDSSVTTLPDSATTGARTLSETPSVLRTIDHPNPSIASPQPPLFITAPTDVAVENFATTSDRATTTAAVVNTSKSFTVTAWVKATGGDGTYRAAISQLGVHLTGFLLQLDTTNHLRFCLPPDDAVGVIFDCATSAEVLDSSSPAWYFVAGQWDAVNHQIRLSVGGGDPTATFHDTNPNTTSSFMVGAGGNNPGLEHWVGSVFEPTVMQAIATPDELAQLRGVPPGTDYRAPGAVDA